MVLSSAEALGQEKLGAKQGERTKKITRREGRMNAQLRCKNFYAQQQQHNQKYQQTRAIRFLLTSAEESMPMA